VTEGPLDERMAVPADEQAVRQRAIADTAVRIRRAVTGEIPMPVHLGHGAR